MSDAYKPASLSASLMASAAKLMDAKPLGNKPITLETLRADMFATQDMIDRGQGSIRNVAAALFMVWHSNRVSSGPTGETPSMAALIVGPHDTTLTQAGKDTLAMFAADVVPPATEGDALSVNRTRAKRAMLSFGIVDACIWHSLGVTLADYVPDARTFTLPLSAFIPFGHYPVSVVEAAHSRAPKVVVAKAADKLDNRIPVGVGLVIRLEREEDAPESLKTIAFCDADATTIVRNRVAQRAMAAAGSTDAKVTIANTATAPMGARKPGAQASSPAAASVEASAQISGTPAKAPATRTPRTPSSGTVAPSQSTGSPMVFATLPAMLPHMVDLLNIIDGSAEGIRTLMGDATTFDRLQTLERVIRDIRTKAVAMTKADAAKAKQAKPAAPTAPAADTKAA